MGVPIDVDVSQRLREIAEATLAVVAEDTAGGVTIRAVAAKLGGSTTVVTNYVPSRAALLLNAVRHTLQLWEQEQGELGGAQAPAPLRELTDWSTATEGHDVTVRRLFLELVATSHRDSEAAGSIRGDAAQHRHDLERGAREAGSDDAAFVADALFLAIRGFYLASIEDPDRWGSARAAPVVDRLVDVLLQATGGSPEDASGPAGGTSPPAST